MKKILLIIVLLFPFTILLAQKTEIRHVSGFSKIDASGVFSIVINKSDTESLVIEADEQVMPHVRSEVKDGELKLYLDNYKSRKMPTLKATIGMSTLNGVELSGTCKLMSNDLFDVPKFEIDLSGATSVKMNLKAQEFELDASGASSVDIKAEVHEADMDISGACNMQLDLQAANASLDMSGGCKAIVVGMAKHADLGISGAGSINAVDFIAQKAYVKSSGAPTVKVYATEHLEVKSSGAGTVYYKGRPTLKVQTSGTSKVTPMD